MKHGLIRFGRAVWPLALLALALAGAWRFFPDRLTDVLGKGSLGDWAQAYAAILAAPVVVYAGRSLRENRRIAILNKRADVILHCAMRYDALYLDRHSLAASGDRLGATMFYNRYWGLKSDQLDYYLAGWIDIDTLRSWLYSTFVNMKSDMGLAVGAAESWESSRDYHMAVNPYFAQLVDVMFELARVATSPRNELMAINALLSQLEHHTNRVRRMIQRRYTAKEYLRTLRRQPQIIDRAAIARIAGAPIYRTA